MNQVIKTIGTAAVGKITNDIIKAIGSRITGGTTSVPRNGKRGKGRKIQRPNQRKSRRTAFVIQPTMKKVKYRKIVLNGRFVIDGQYDTTQAAGNQVYTALNLVGEHLELRFGEAANVSMLDILDWNLSMQEMWSELNAYSGHYQYFIPTKMKMVFVPVKGADMAFNIVSPLYCDCVYRDNSVNATQLRTMNQFGITAHKTSKLVFKYPKPGAQTFADLDTEKDEFDWLPITQAKLEGIIDKTKFRLVGPGIQTLLAGNSEKSLWNVNVLLTLRLRGNTEVADVHTNMISNFASLATKTQEKMESGVVSDSPHASQPRVENNQLTTEKRVKFKIEDGKEEKKRNKYSGKTQQEINKIRHNKQKINREWGQIFTDPNCLTDSEEN